MAKKDEIKTAVNIQELRGLLASVGNRIELLRGYL